jgi:hypothetical protein
MKKMVFLLFVYFAISSCKEGNVQPSLDGEYVGKFYYGSLFGTTQEGAASVKIANGRFQSVGNNSRIPAGGSGAVSVVDSNTVLFSDENVWTANFDWALVLNGKYSVNVKDDSLFLDKKIEGNGGINPPIIRYKLKRLK